MDKQSKYIETEIKIQLFDLKTLVSNLIKVNATFLGKDFQRTVRMDTPDMDLEKKGLFLRVRSGFGNTVTLKVKNKEVKDFMQRDEYETEVKDLRVLSDIFSILGFSKQLILEKYRANFLYRGVKISIDELHFGTYVELEGDENKINNVAKELGLDMSDRINVTYWDLFEDYKKRNNIQSQENIVFPRNYKSQIMKLNLLQK